MSKRVEILFGIGSLALAVVCITMLPFFKGASFEVINRSKQPVYISAYWLDQSKELGSIKPSATFRFSVGDEAAMKFIGRYPDGREVVSQEIYFSNRIAVKATVTEHAIEMEYDFET